MIFSFSVISFVMCPFSSLILFESSHFFFFLRTSLVVQTVKHLPTVWENQVQSLGWEDLLEKEMATHSYILVWTEKPGRLQPMGSKRVGHD